MPLVRIDVVEGRRTPEQLRLLADTVQEAMLDRPVVGNTGENSSSGLGRAQLLEGEL